MLRSPLRTRSRRRHRSPTSLRTLSGLAATRFSPAERSARTRTTTATVPRFYRASSSRPSRNRNHRMAPRGARQLIRYRQRRQRVDILPRLRSRSVRSSAWSSAWSSARWMSASTSAPCSAADQHLGRRPVGGQSTATTCHRHRPRRGAVRAGWGRAEAAAGSRDARRPNRRTRAGPLGDQGLSR